MNTRRTAPDSGSSPEQRSSDSRWMTILRDYIYILFILVFFAAVICADNCGQSRTPEQKNDMRYCWRDETGAAVDMEAMPKGNLLLHTDVHDIDIADQHLCMISMDTMFDVFADEQCIYSYRPTQAKLLGRSYGMAVHTIAVPPWTETLQIQTEPIFQDVSGTLTNMVLEDAGKYISDIYKYNLSPFIRSIFTVLLGILFLLLGFPRGILSRLAGIDAISFGAMCLLLGFAGMNDTFILQIITQQPAVIRVLTYVCVIFVPYPALNFFVSATGSRHTVAQTAMILLCAANFTATVTLTLLGVSDYFYMVKVSHAIFLIDFLFAVFLVARAVRRKTIRPQLVRCLSAGLSAVILGAGLDLLRYYQGIHNGFANFSRIGVLLFIVLIGVYLFREQTRSMKQRHRESVTFIQEITDSLAKVIDMKDTYTNGHSFRVAKYTAMLTKELGFDADTVEKYYRIALLHDIGKVGIPAEVLNKPGKLTVEEYEIIKSHTVKGYEALKDISILPELAVGARSHHERPDGKGYPEGLKGDEIPRVAQIIAVADCFDAMYSNRPYRKRMNFERAVSIIRDVAGKQLSEDVVDAFLRLVERGEFLANNDTGGGSMEDIDNIRHQTAE